LQNTYPSTRPGGEKNILFQNCAGTLTVRSLRWDGGAVMDLVPVPVPFFSLLAVDPIEK